MEKELSTAATPLCFGFYRCRVMSCKANFYVVRSALQCFYQTNKSLRSPLPSFPMRGNSSNETKMAAKLSKEEAEEYFTRINYTGWNEPTVEVLTELHRCHILSVPFENLSVYGKEKIELSKEGLEGGVLIPHSRPFFVRIPHPALFSSVSRIPLFFPTKIH